MDEVNRRKLRKTIRGICGIIGFLGAVDSAAIGFYLLSTMFNPVLISELMLQGYIVLITFATITTMLIYGSFLILKNKNAEKAAKINLTAGLILTFLYVYYAHFSNPTLLNWLSPTGALLIMPALASGIISEITLR